MTPGAGARRARALSAVGQLSRRALAQGALGWRTAGVAKRAIAPFASETTLTYHDAVGHLMEADLTDPMQRAGFFGAHSPVMLRMLRSLLAPGDWAVDVGANVGIVTSRMAAAVGPNGRVWAFEPLPANVARLTALKEVNGLNQLRVLPVALSSENATARLRIPVGGGSAWGSFVAGWETSGEMEVPTRRLDDVVDEHGWNGRISVLKIDAEGAEPAVVDGAERVLREMRPVVLCELNDILLDHAGTSSRALLDQFAELGYALVSPMGRRPRKIAGCTTDAVLTPVERPGPSVDAGGGPLGRWLDRRWAARVRGEGPRAREART